MGLRALLSKVADDTTMSAVVVNLEGRDPIQRYLLQCGRPSAISSTWIRGNIDTGWEIFGLRAALLRKT